MNVLILSVGTHSKIVQYFKKTLNGNGQVIAADMSPSVPSISEADKYYAVPSMNAPEYLDVILDVCQKEKIDGILSLIDSERSLLTQNKDKFSEIGTTVIDSNFDFSEMSLDKMQMSEFCQQYGFNAARSRDGLTEFEMECENRAPDIYFDSNFAKLYENIEHGVSTEYRVDCQYGSVSHVFLTREIPQLVDGVQYYDAITAYGYGGPIVLNVLTPDGLSVSEARQKLIQVFADSYSQYCKERRIVSEFVRFHPLFNNAEDFKELFAIQHLRNTVGTNLQKYPDFEADEYTKGCRKIIRQTMKTGITVEVDESPETLDDFKEIYYSTMDRNHADAYYYFQDDYFDKCMQLYRENILLVKAIYEGKIIAAGFYFVWNDIVHMHLSGTLSEYLHLSPAYMLRYGVTQWAVEHGYKMIHHGGGKSNSPDDSLYQFKKRFGKNTEFPFFVGKKIWNQRVYDELCLNCPATDFFPAYRSR